MVQCSMQTRVALFDRGIGRTGLRYPDPDMTAIWSGTWFLKRPGIEPEQRTAFHSATSASGSAPERVHYKLSRAAPLNAKPDMFRDDQLHDRP